MSRAVAGDGLVITGWSAVSPFGIGRAAFTDGVHGVHGAHDPPETPNPRQGRGPGEQARLVPDFTPAAVLGKKGTRAMDRVTGLALAAVGQLVDRSEPAGEDVAVVLGTTSGSAESIMDFARDSLTGEKPFFVDPARFPNAVMNCAAGQCAIWYGLKGPNATIAGGRVSVLHALTYARRLLAAHRARTVLCGAVEEYSRSRAWLEWHGRADDDDTGPLGEGGVVLRVEPADTARERERRPLADVLAVQCRVVVDGAVGAAVASCVRGVLDQARITPADVWLVASGDSPGPAGAAERDALARVLPPDGVLRVSTTALVGDASAAGAAFQIATVLAVADRTPEVAGRIALVTSVDRGDGVGCALLRLR
jgi:3-oxoacyl-[acyl-carrier-protein] synthase II